MTYLLAFYGDQHHLVLGGDDGGDGVIVDYYELRWKHCIVEIKYIPNAQPDHVNIIIASSSSLFFLHGTVLPHYPCKRNLCTFFLSQFFCPHHKPCIKWSLGTTISNVFENHMGIINNSFRLKFNDQKIDTTLM